MAWRLEKPGTCNHVHLKDDTTGEILDTLTLDELFSPISGTESRRVLVLKLIARAFDINTIVGLNLRLNLLGSLIDRIGRDG